MRFTWGCLCVLFSVIYLSGCQFAPGTKTAIQPMTKSEDTFAKTVTLGVFIDNRFSYFPPSEVGRDEEGKDKGRRLETLPDTKEVRIPMGRARSRLALTLRHAGMFDEIISPPTNLLGESLNLMVQNSLENSDYLIVGEINTFYIKNAGRNSKAIFTVPLDFTLLFIPNLLVFPLSGGKALTLTGGAIAVRTVECFLSLAITIYSVDTGRPLTTFTVEERAFSPVDTVTIYGDLYNDRDDWIDIGRTLGETALANACNKAVTQIGQSIKKELSQNTGEQ